MTAPVASGWGVRRGRDRGGARNLRPRLGCFGVSAVRARLALSIVRVSVRPPCHPGRSHLTSPVGDHDYPCAIFPDSPWLIIKRSLAYAPSPFLPLSHRPSPSPTGPAVPQESAQRLQSTAGVHAGCRGGRGVYVRAERGSLPPRVSDMLAVRMGN
jgi:hypothetical protein